MIPEDVKTYEPGLAADFMLAIGHDYRVPAIVYLKGRPMPDWPNRKPLVTGIPSAVFGVQSQQEDEARIIGAWGASFCGGLAMSDLMESDRWLK